MKIKDNFSAQSHLYARFRPRYPAELYRFIFSWVKEFNLAWDVGTGNGQSALSLAERFKTVFATDVSEQQLKNAAPAPNIVYKLEQAEHSSLENNSVDLVAIAQALHWFNFRGFYKEVNRVLKPGGVIAAFGYNLIRSTNGELNELIDHLYYDILGNYWDEERKHVEQNYTSIPFPFKEVSHPALSIHVQWKEEQLLGYLASWSAYQKYLKTNANCDTCLDIFNQIKRQFLNCKVIAMELPVFFRVGLKEP